MGNVLDPTNGYIVHGWMVTELGLKGPELTTYAIVHQFSQSKAGIYKGGVPYIMAWLGCNRNSARKYLHSLEARGLIKAIDGDINGVPFRDYQIIDAGIPQNLGYMPQKTIGDTPKNDRGIPQNLTPDNKRDNKEIIKEKDFLEKEKAIAELFFRNLSKPVVEVDKLAAYNSGPGVRKKWSRLDADERAALAKLWRQDSQQPPRFDTDFLDAWAQVYGFAATSGAPVPVRKALLSDTLRYHISGESFILHVPENLASWLEDNMDSLQSALFHTVRWHGCEKLRYQIQP